MRLLAALLILTLSACATIAPPAAAPQLQPVEGEAIPCTPKRPCAYTDGVWMPTDLAAYKAGRCAESEDAARRCQAELAGIAAPGVPWVAIGISLAGGFALGWAVTR
jgi:hypothetical protein